MNKTQTTIIFFITGLIFIVAGIYGMKQHKQIEELKESLTYNVQINLDMAGLIQDTLGISVSFADCVGDESKDTDVCNYAYFSVMQDVILKNKDIINKIYKPQ